MEKYFLNCQRNLEIVDCCDCESNIFKVQFSLQCQIETTLMKEAPRNMKESGDAIIQAILLTRTMMIEMLASTIFLATNPSLTKYSSEMKILLNKTPRNMESSGSFCPNTRLLRGGRQRRVKEKIKDLGEMFLIISEFPMLLNQSTVSTSS